MIELVPFELTSEEVLVNGGGFDFEYFSANCAQVSSTLWLVKSTLVRRERTHTGSRDHRVFNVGVSRSCSASARPRITF